MWVLKSICHTASSIRLSQSYPVTTTQVHVLQIQIISVSPTHTHQRSGYDGLWRVCTHGRDTSRRASDDDELLMNKWTTSSCFNPGLTHLPLLVINSQDSALSVGVFRYKSFQWAPKLKCTHSPLLLNIMCSILVESHLEGKRVLVSWATAQRVAIIKHDKHTSSSPSEHLYFHFLLRRRRHNHHNMQPWKKKDEKKKKEAPHLTKFKSTMRLLFYFWCQNSPEIQH